jgi:ATP-dependent DNA ligase
MQLPVMPPVKPMLATAKAVVPEQPESAQGRWLYEPKWDGFRCLVFRDGDEVLLGSRNERPLTRYFPEVVAAVLAELPRRCVLDGELVVPQRRPGADGDQDGYDRLDWDSLSQRIHPAESRIRMLAEKTPAHFVAFDILALGDESLLDQPFAVRRQRLEQAMTQRPEAGLRCHLTTVTDDPARARGWFEMFEGAGLDGVIAKPLDVGYLPDKRAMVKVKHHRTAECVVIGYRRHKSLPDAIGSMLLGLYAPVDEPDPADAAGPADAAEPAEPVDPQLAEYRGWAEKLWGEAGPGLRMVGGASAFTAARRKELLVELDAYRVADVATAPGEPNRWAAREDHSWVPLRPELVVEVEYDQMEGSRFRHAARFLRWRPDKQPRQCSYDQLEVPVRYDLADVLSGGRAADADRDAAGDPGVDRG